MCGGRYKSESTKIDTSIYQSQFSDIAQGRCRRRLRTYTPVRKCSGNVLLSADKFTLTACVNLILDACISRHHSRPLSLSTSQTWCAGIANTSDVNMHNSRSRVFEYMQSARKKIHRQNVFGNRAIPIFGGSRHSKVY